MKRAVIFLSVVATAIVACSQDIPAKKVPSVVQNTVTARFTHSSDIEWKKKKDMYMAEFKIDKAEHTAYVAANGTLLMVKKDITATSLPQQVTGAVMRDYAGYQIDDVDQLEKDGAIYYQVELEKSKAKDVHQVYSPDGIMAKNISYLH